MLPVDSHIISTGKSSTWPRYVLLSRGLWLYARTSGRAWSSRYVLCPRAKGWDYGTVGLGLVVVHTRLQNMCYALELRAGIMVR